MAEKALGSADELNIDNFFREQSGSSTVADESEEDKPDTSENAPDEETDKKSKKRSGKDSDDDIDLEDEDDSEEGDDDSKDDDDLEDDDLLDEDEDKDAGKKKKKDVSKELEALQTKATNAERQRSQMQSERDTYKAQFEKANEKIDSLTENVDKLTKLTEKLTKKTEQSTSSKIFTGDDDNLMTEGQFKKAFDEYLKMSRGSDSSYEDDRPMTSKEMKAEMKAFLKEQSEASTKTETQDQGTAKIGSDLESEKIWAEGQPDVVEITNYYVENRTALDPELATIPSYSARYQGIRLKKMESELASYKKALRKAKQKIKRMGKGELPETASSDRRKPATNDKQPRDALTDFFEK